VSISLSGAALSAFNPESDRVKDLVASAARLEKKDSALWGADAAIEAAVRLNWVDLPLSSRHLLPELDALSAWARSHNLTNVILCGMGGSSLAPEVIGKTFSKKLSVLDSTDPAQIRAAIPASLENSIIVVGSKSGSTIETASQKALFTELLIKAGLNPADHLVIVTDPGSPLDQSARADGLRTINADPHVGGRYSALSAFGLVPAALLGIDVSLLLDDAATAAAQFTEPNSTAVVLADLLFSQTDQSIAFFDEGSNVPGISDWIEQLVAESTGKNQTGRLPIVIESSDSPISGEALKIGFSVGVNADLVVTGSLGEHFILWEWVTALLSRALAIDPFNQPNVTEAKERTGEILSIWSDGVVIQPTPAFENEVVALYSDEPAESLEAGLKKFFATPTHYVAIMAYLARGIDDDILKVRPVVADKTQRGTTFGWGPRFLHSTGQFHKGGQHNGAFMQITGESAIDLEIPGRNFGFHTLLMAQALGDGAALSSRAFPLVRIHLKDRERGITELLEALQAL
jgi:glucose-6-phosphate isomerase